MFSPPPSDDDERPVVAPPTDSNLGRLSSSSNPKELPKTITLMPAVAIIIGTIIGTGIFKSPHTIVKEVNSIGMTLVVWLLTGLLSQFAALCYLELGLMLKKSGGEYTYARWRVSKG